MNLFRGVVYHVNLLAPSCVLILVCYFSESDSFALTKIMFWRSLMFLNWILNRPVAVLEFEIGSVWLEELAS